MPIVLDSPIKTKGSGSAGVALPGSGMSIPTLVAATEFEINGLILNRRSDLEHYWIEEIDGLYDAEVVDSREKKSDRHGEIYNGGMYSGKPITISGWIYARSMEKLLDMQAALRAAFRSLKQESVITAHTGNPNRDWLFYAVKTGQMGLRDKQDSYSFKREFMLTLRSSQPYIFGAVLHSASKTLSTGNGVDVVHLGDAEEVYPRILLFGQQTGVTITNNVTGQQFKLNGAIPAGRYYEIDFDAGTIFDDLGVNHFDQYDHTSDWLYLAPETTQTLTVASTGRNASASITVYWRDTYG